MFKSKSFRRVLAVLRFADAAGMSEERLSVMLAALIGEV